MNFYNNYVKHDTYASEIAFVNVWEPSVITKYLYYVKFSDNTSGFYLDKNRYLEKLDQNHRINLLNINDLSNGYITDVVRAIHHFAFIKVIKDYKNPQLEGQIMLFKFGTCIKNKIEEYFNSDVFYFKKTFKFIVEFKGHIPSFEFCRFTDTDISVYDKNLDLNSELKFKTVPLLADKRREKLEKLKNL